ncbi:hypothetical protein quinque_011489 [Culex quinquefasciatus]
MKNNFPKLWLAVCTAASIVGLARGQFGPCYGTTGVVNIPDPADCTRFFICVNGQDFPNQCSEGLIFDVLTGQCNRAEVSVCIVDVPTIPTAGPGETTVAPGPPPGPEEPTPAPVDPTPGPGETEAPSEDPGATTVPIPTAPVETTTPGPIPTAPTEPGVTTAGPEIPPPGPGTTEAPAAPTPGPAPTTEAPAAPTPAPATTTPPVITTTLAPVTTPAPPAPTPTPTVAPPVTTTVAPPPPVTTTVAPPPPVTTTVAPPPPTTTPPPPPPPPGPTPTCNAWDDFYAPHPDCTRFFRCVFGTLHVLNCPPNQFWNQARLYCDHQWNVVCPASG